MSSWLDCLVISIWCCSVHTDHYKRDDSLYFRDPFGEHRNQE